MLYYINHIFTLKDKKNNIMSWLIDNKRYAVLLLVVLLTIIEMGLVAFGLPTIEGFDTAIIVLLTLGVKEFIDGTPDKTINQ